MTADGSDKIDLYKLHRAEYKAGAKPVLVDVGRGQYLAVEGQGPPGGEDFQQAVGALYGMAYTVKMTRKFEGRGDYVVCKLEARYWADGTRDDWAELPPGQWRWQMLIRTPDVVGDEDLREAVVKLVAKGKGEGCERVRLTELAEGRCVQMLHVGPYEEEARTLAVMRDLAGREGLSPAGRHHEIYLSDPRRVAPEKLRTILRMPVTKA